MNEIKTIVSGTNIRIEKHEIITTSIRERKKNNEGITILIMYGK